MARFSALPPEIHDTIAKNCQNNDLINLSCTSKWVKELYLRVLYHHVDLRPDRSSPVFMEDERKLQERFFQSLLAHPEYGQHVRFFRALLHIPDYGDGYNISMLSYEELWRAMQLLTHVKTVDMGSRYDIAYRTAVLTKEFPSDWFRSTTSVTLVGRMPYRLAKSILDAVNPATLNYLCLDVVQQWDYGYIPHTPMPISYEPGHMEKDGRLIAYGATSGLLTTLTGCCTALRTLILRRVGQASMRLGWACFAEELSHIEWASFIRSVQGTVERFTFELAKEMPGVWLKPEHYAFDSGILRIADERFQQFILSAIIAGNWPCLNIMEIRGVKSLDGQWGTAALVMELTAHLGGNTKIVVEEERRYVEDDYVPEDVFTNPLFLVNRET